jgi:hypothetical protein
MELALKAYLLHGGASERMLRKYSHDLEACLLAAEDKGLGRHLTLTVEERDDLKQINEYYQGKELEYAFGKAMTFPPIDNLRDMVSRSLTVIFNPLTEQVFQAAANPPPK